jgi:hypothetical protein
MTRTIRTTVLTLALLATAACGDDSPTGSSQSNVTGTYNLLTVNAVAPPASVYQGPEGRVDITGGSMVLRADKSYTETITFRVQPTGGPAVNDQAIENGTYVQNGQTIQFTVPAQAGEPAFSYQGTVNSGTLSYTFEGTALVYRK